MEISSCSPHSGNIQIGYMTYEDATILQALLESDRSQYSRWKELVITLNLIANANMPKETAV